MTFFQIDCSNFSLPTLPFFVPSHPDAAKIFPFFLTKNEKRSKNGKNGELGKMVEKLEPVTKERKREIGHGIEAQAVEEIKKFSMKEVLKTDGVSLAILFLLYVLQVILSFGRNERFPGVKSTKTFLGAFVFISSGRFLK